MQLTKGRVSGANACARVHTPVGQDLLRDLVNAEELVLRSERRREDGEDLGGKAECVCVGEVFVGLLEEFEEVVEARSALEACLV